MFKLDLSALILAFIFHGYKNLLLFRAHLGSIKTKIAVTFIDNQIAELHYITYKTVWAVQQAIKTTSK